MTLDQAKRLRKQLLYLENMITWRTQEYVWKIMIGPKDPDRFYQFRQMVDPTILFDPKKLLKPYLPCEVSLYFFCKTAGDIICRDYVEFLSANQMNEILEEIELLDPYIAS